jgi:hypothetical protein
MNMRRQFCQLLVLSTFVLLPAAGNAAAGDGGRIVGTARLAADDSPLRSGLVYVTDADGRPIDTIPTVDGAFASERLPPGDYRAYMRNTETLVGQVYGLPYCFSGPSREVNLCDPRDGAPIEVRAGRDTAIEFSLSAGAFIGGEVFDSEGALASTGTVEIWYEGVRIWWRSFWPNGPYRAGPFPPGSFTVRAEAFGMAFQVYPDHVCLAICNLEAGGEAVVLQVGENRLGVDFHLHRLGRVSGRVEDRATGAAIGGARVRFYEAANRLRLARSTLTEADGTFTAQLPPGEFLVAAGDQRHEWRAFADVPFIPGYEAGPLRVAASFKVPENGSVDLPPLRLLPLGRSADE